MSTAKGSTPAASKAVGPKTGEKGKRNFKPLPGVKKSAKYAPARRQRLYVNNRKKEIAKAKRSQPTGRTKSLNRMVRRKQIQKHIKNAHAKKTAKALKEGKPAPPAYPVSRIEKRLKRKAEAKKEVRAEKETKKKARVEVAKQFQAALGSNFKAASKAWNSGVRPKALSAITSIYHSDKPAKKVALKTGQKRDRRHLPNPWKPAVPGWGSAQRLKWKLNAEPKARKPRRNLKQVMAQIAAGRPLPLTRQMRKDRIRAKVEAHNAPIKAAAAKAREGKPAKPIHPAAQKRLDKAKRVKEHNAANWAKKLAQKAADKAKAEAAGAVYVPRKPKKQTRKATFRLYKKIPVLNLDRVVQRRKPFANRGGRLRRSIRPGTVVIIVKGKFAGRRAIFLRQLHPSKSLLVTGPFKINGVPLYRINQSFVIATSTRVNVAKVPGLKGNILKDSLFYIRRKVGISKKNTTARRNVTSETEFFTKDKPTKRFPELHKSWVQKRTDAPLIEIINKHPVMKAYLQTSFGLSDKDAPHRMKF